MPIRGTPHDDANRLNALWDQMTVDTTNPAISTGSDHDDRHVIAWLQSLTPQPSPAQRRTLRSKVAHLIGREHPVTTHTGF